MKLNGRLALYFILALVILLSFFTPRKAGATREPADHISRITSNNLIFAKAEQARERSDSGSTSVRLPLWGEINTSDYSLPALAIILGLVDGFNPCAMWALVYLISLVMSIRDKKKLWFIVGTFVFSSGVLYFLFMAAWLNAFLVIGYFRPITVVMGLVAIYLGFSSLFDVIKKKGIIACEVTDEPAKKKTMTRMRNIVLSPVTATTLLSTIALAFIINSLEFVCSFALPAVFTHVLSLSLLPRLEHYSYILLYDLCFMLDDLIIFGSAVFAFNTVLGTKYMVYGRILGGILLIVLGLLLTFMPRVLMTG